METEREERKREIKGRKDDWNNAYMVLNSVIKSWQQDPFGQIWDNTYAVFVTMINL